MDDRLDSWSVPDPLVRAAILVEVRTEVDAQHRLARELQPGRGPGVAARCDLCEVVCLALVEDVFALVRLSWSGRTAPPPWPVTRFTGSWSATREVMHEHTEDHLRELARAGHPLSAALHR